MRHSGFSMKHPCFRSSQPETGLILNFQGYVTTPTLNESGMAVNVIHIKMPLSQHHRTISRHSTILVSLRHFVVFTWKAAHQFCRDKSLTRFLLSGSFSFVSIVWMDEMSNGIPSLRREEIWYMFMTDARHWKRVNEQSYLLHVRVDLKSYWSWKRLLVNFPLRLETIFLRPCLVFVPFYYL
jgi:hypothetical protein